VALNLAISTTLLSYMGIFPAALVLRRKRPDDPRPYHSPALWFTTIISTLFIVFCTIQTLFPGLGDGWFAKAYRPSDDWQRSEKWTFLLTEAVPLLIFLAISVAFWYMGKRHRDQTRRELDAGVPVSASAVLSK
jgi:amino acid transporter